MTAWVKWSAAQSATNEEAILFQGDTAHNGYGLFVTDGSPTILLAGHGPYSPPPAPCRSAAWAFLAAERRNGVVVADDERRLPVLPARKGRPWHPTPPRAGSPSAAPTLGGGAVQRADQSTSPRSTLRPCPTKRWQTLAGDEALSFTLNVALVTPRPRTSPRSTGSALLLVDGVSTDVVFAVRAGVGSGWSPPRSRSGVHTFSAVYRRRLRPRPEQYLVDRGPLHPAHLDPDHCRPRRSMARPSATSPASRARSPGSAR